MEQLLKELEIAIDSIDELEDEMEFIPVANQILDKIKALPNSFEGVEAILKIIEEKEDKDYGGPGPIGHFLESFYTKGYEELLLQSLKRKPKEFTIYLLQRCINDEDNANRLEYLTLLKEISVSSTVSQEIREAAKESLEYFE